MEFLGKMEFKSDTHGKWLSESKKKKFRPKAAIWDRAKQSSICGLVCQVAAGF